MRRPSDLIGGGAVVACLSFLMIPGETSRASPGCFNVPAPASGSTVSMTPKLTWQPSNAMAYDIRIYDGGRVAGNAVFAINDLSGTCCPAELFRVRAHGGGVR